MIIRFLRLRNNYRHNVNSSVHRTEMNGKCWECDYGMIFLTWRSISGEYLVPPFTGNLWWLCWALYKYSFINKHVNGEKRNRLPVASDSLNLSVVSSQGNVESNYGIASFNQFEIFLRYISLWWGVVEEELDLFEETGFLEFVKFGSVLLWIQWVCLGSGSWWEGSV